MDADLVIVGGGPAGTHVLSALAEHSAPWLASARVVVLEGTDALGPGLPYGDAADPIHTYGRIPRIRRDKGQSLRVQFSRAVEKLGSQGAEIVVQKGTFARSLRCDGAGWRVLSDRGEVRASRAVLATGHWHTHRLAHLNASIDWRWDARRLHARIGDDDDVLVLGTSQSAVDIARTLGERRQHGGRCGSITLASRRGLLPSVWGPLRSARVPPGGAKNLDRLRARPDVRLSDIYEAIRGDVKRLGATLCEDPDGALWPETTGDGAATLLRDVQRARDAIASGEEIPWQAVLWPTVPAVFDLFPRLVAEDRLALKDRWSQWLRYLEAIHVGAAEHMLDLIDDGFVRVRALGDPIALTEDARGVVARGPLGEARGRWVIDARGHDPHIERSHDEFLRSVLACGRATTARVPFASPDGVGEGGETARVAGIAHLITGGLWVDPATFRVRDADGATSSLYALGPLTMGQFPVYLGLWALRAAAARIARSLSDGGGR